MPLIIKELTIIIPVVQVDKELHTINLETETITMSVDEFCKAMNMDKDRCMEKIIDLLYGIDEEVEEVSI